MKRITITILLLATAAGCSTNRSATGGRAAREGNGTVTGIIMLGEGVGPKTGDFCEGLTVKVTHASAPEDVLGDRMVKVSRGRCSYQVAHLPSGGEELQFTVTPSSAWKCDNGTAPTISSAPQSIKLQNWQTLTQDFRVTCEAPAAATSTP
ncbi:hypothetical protein [Vitiosangium sp. GDMCC 1.1324]|uniref:hypothetical protein n=1 Tax=Vitiosangium sp. (strain GDMCC 1.1324) TaxID=2138576 RepID=UPI000D3C648F|nr:hypothetical protein [Vitiosangium sp. GDMCC 1.1324]PTL83472.1 hypothetical protein DAT35_16015 [Vitiosangium sp. GDMCC 1.1324]